MGLRIIYGRAGSGKSAFCFEEISQRIKYEEKIYMITPEQFSFTAEQKLLNAIETESSLNAEVITFGRCANRVISEVGGLKQNLISENIKKMLIYDMLLKGEENLTFLGKNKENVELISDTITELKKHCVKLDTLNNVINKAEDQRLKLKLKDISYCYDNFQMQMGDKYIEPNDILSILPEKLENSDMFKGSIVYIDEFSGFTTQEYEIIKVLIKQAKEVTITITSDELENQDETGLFYLNNKSAKKLKTITEEEHVTFETPVFLKEQYRFKNEELKLLEKNLYNYKSKESIDIPSHIHMYMAKNPYEEIEKVAREITDLVKQKEYSYNDISVITKDTEESGALIKAIFRSYEIPNFIDEKKDLTQNVLIKFLLLVLEILAKGWTQENVLASVKTDFFPITEDEEYDLENYVISWGIKGKAWFQSDWTNGFDSDEDKTRMNNIRTRVVNPIITLKEQLGRQKTVKDICKKIYEFLKEINVEETLQNKINELMKIGEVEIAKEYASSLEMVVSILDEMAEVIGKNQTSFEKFAELIKIGFSGHTLGAIPATLDQVIIGDVDRSRSHKVKAVFIIGLNDGIFPSYRKEEGFLNDTDRHVLEDMGIELAKDSTQNLYEEQFSIYKAFSTAEEELYLSYPIADKDGSAIRPSNLVYRIKKIFPEIKEESEILKKEIKIENKKATFDNLLYTIKDLKPGEKPDETWQAVYEIFREDDEWNGKLKAALEGLKDTNLPVKIDKSNIKKLYGNVLKTSVSRLEQYRRCPFSFHLKYGLKLQEPAEFNLKSINTGTFMHDAIEKFFDTTEERGINYKELEERKLDEIISEIIRDELSLSKNQIFNSSTKFQSLTKRLEKVIQKAIKYIIEQLKYSDFKINGTEIEFSDKSVYEPIRLELDTGEKIEVTGKIDRVDIAQDDSGKYLRIIDYKSSAKNIDLGEVVAGLQIQLLTYLDAATDIEKAIPAGIFYFGLIDSIIESKKDKTDEEIEQELKKQFKLNGILLADVHVARMMDNKLERGSSNVIPAYIDKDGQLSLNRSSVVNEEQFKNLQKHTKKIIKQISKEILSGNIDIKPYKSKNKRTTCEFCSYKSICTFSPEKKGNDYFRIKDMEKQEILEKIKNEE
ncbi:MAG: helicase-exonuclease AddAB subunit AddB [Clostridia bacterium]|nr:helicase-exonuclease AddAB subunit AddB [Clostridia bacterium]